MRCWGDAVILLHVGDHLPRATVFWDFFAQWRVEVAPLIVILGVILVYIVGLRRLKSRTIFEPVTACRILLFALGIFALLLSLMSPIDTYSSDLFFLHMVQHLLLIMVAVPLLLLSNSMPVFMWFLPRTLRYEVGDLLAKGGVIRRVLIWATSPKVAFLIYVAVIWGWHMPIAYDAALANTPLHYFEHLTMFAAAVFFWWYVIGPAPIRPRSSYQGRMLYLLLATVLNTALGIGITFSGSTLYSFYADAPRHWGISVAQDMELGGLIMWIPGNMMFLVSVAILFLVWANREERHTTQQQQVEEKRRRYLEGLSNR